MAVGCRLVPLPSRAGVLQVGAARGARVGGARQRSARARRALRRILGLTLARHEARGVLLPTAARRLVPAPPPALPAMLRPSRRSLHTHCVRWCQTVRSARPMHHSMVAARGMGIWGTVHRVLAARLCTAHLEVDDPIASFGQPHLVVEGCRAAIVAHRLGVLVTRKHHLEQPSRRIC